MGPQFLCMLQGCESSMNIHDTVLIRSEEHTSELQSLIRNSYAVFCFKKKRWHGPGNQADPKHPTALRMLPTDAADRHRPLAMHDYSPNLNNQTITNSNNTAHR